MNFSRFLVFIVLVLNIVPDTHAQNWPGWRGPNGDGTSLETNLPTRWSPNENILWKVPVAGIGYSSPIVWEDKLFMTTTVNETQERILLCYNSESGELLWQETVLKTPFENKHNDNSYASGTPVTDGTFVFVSFLDGQDVVVAAYDFTGKQIWLERPGQFYSPHGYSCSPVLYEDKVIVNGNSKGKGFSFVAGLSRNDGRTIWKVQHEKDTHSYSTPVFREISGKMQMIYCGNQEIAGYNPDDGSKLWFVDGPAEDFCSSPVYHEGSGLVIVSSAWPRRILVGIKPDGQGNVTESHVVWESVRGAVYVPSPVCTDDYLFTTMTNGMVHCIDPATGNIFWVEDLGRQYSSPVVADGLIYMPNDEGVVTVIKPGPEFEYIAQNYIGEGMYASPAISNGRIYLRGFEHLFCIGNK